MYGMEDLSMRRGAQGLARREQLLPGGMSTLRLDLLCEGASGREAGISTHTHTKNTKIGVVEEVGMRRETIPVRQSRQTRRREKPGCARERETESNSTRIYICRGGGISRAIYQGGWNMEIIYPHLGVGRQFARGLLYPLSKAEYQQQHVATKTGNKIHYPKSTTSLTAALQCSLEKDDRKTLRPIYFPPVPSECHGYAPYRTPEQ